MLTSTQKTT